MIDGWETCSVWASRSRRPRTASQLRSALPVMAGSNVASTLISQPLVIQLDGGKLWNGLATYNQQTGFTLRPLDGGR